MKECIGDLLELAEQGEFDVVVHGCNCFHTFGAGIARAIRNRWPITHHADVKETIRGDRNKLGTITYVDVSPVLTVVNAYTQFDFRGPGPNVDYGAIENAFREIKTRFGFKGYRFGIPLIGAGLAGGDWSQIAPIIEEQMKGEDLTLVRLP